MIWIAGIILTALNGWLLYMAIDQWGSFTKEHKLKINDFKTKIFEYLKTHTDQLSTDQENLKNEFIELKMTILHSLDDFKKSFITKPIKKKK